MRKPFEGEFPVTQRFGERITDPSGHTGIDYALYTGTPVLAAMDGRVSRTAYLKSGYGTHVVVEHDGGLETLYAHLSGISVRLGESVREGQQIGTSGNTGNTTGPHLHFEMRRLGKPVDPEQFFSPVPGTDPSGTRRVSIPLLYVRSGPGTEYPIVDSLKQGMRISGDRTAETVWLRIGENRWAAIRYQGEDFCESVS